ncbi:hypothetical protein EJ03DRAFT_129882 [Teratosphaeria nubilosa]|uniref:Uncharacterized protein n=1 Tax=Teratosphaeria nubilosa TaxID=161662 RepID=A0A6G1LKH4_9PEZI|nr:hypothetical protein EJ03DRAFT_129882 [Teratosphaeria nubilosa]
MAMNHHAGEHIALITSLLVEKDRLLFEKDELLESKSKMCNEVQKIIRDQNIELARLRQQNETDCLLVANKRLASERDELVESRAKMLREHRKIRREQKYEIAKFREQNEKLLELLSAYIDAEEEGSDGSEVMNINEHDDNEEKAVGNPLLDDSGFGRTLADTYPSPESPVRREVPGKELVQFIFSPVAGISVDGELELGDFERVPDAVKTTMQRAEAIRASCFARNLLAASPGDKPISPCFYLWAQGTGSLRRWTIENPKKYACASCFNGRRVCMAWQGKKTWAFLPLPPQLRKAESTWQDAGYYIYDGDSTTKASEFESIWAASKASKKRKR